MKIDLDAQRLPTIYKRDGRDCYLDAIRKRLIYITPEETVRQHVISYLLDSLHVPEDAIRVEEHLSHYGVDSKRRADIIIEAYSEEKNIVYPLVVIECKAPNVAITEKVFDQMFDYADKLVADYVMATNGYEAEYYHYSEKDRAYEHITEFPVYVEMVKGSFNPLPPEEPFERLTLDEIIKKDGWKRYVGYEVGANTPEAIARSAVNLWDSLQLSDGKMPAKQYKLFKLIEDYGLRMLEYGNSSGGSFAGIYHSYLVEYNGSTEFVSVGLSSYVTYAHPDIVKTALNVAIDNEKTSHHSLQLVLDDNLDIDGNQCKFLHHRRVAVGNKGCGKIEELRMFVADRYPDIIDGKKFNLGTLTNDHLWNADEDDMLNLLENLISYALIRDEYRAFLKQ